MVKSTKHYVWTCFSVLIYKYPKLPCLYEKNSLFEWDQSVTWWYIDRWILYLAWWCIWQLYSPPCFQPQSLSKSPQETEANSAENESRVPSESESVDLPVVSNEDPKHKKPARRGRGSKSAPKVATQAAKDAAKSGRGRKTRKSAGACVGSEEKIVGKSHQWCYMHKQPHLSSHESTPVEDHKTVLYSSQP